MTHGVFFLIRLWRGAAPTTGRDAALRQLDTLYDRHRLEVARKLGLVAAFTARISVLRVSAARDTGETYGECLAFRGEDLRARLDVLDLLYIAHRDHLARFAAQEMP